MVPLWEAIHIGIRDSLASLNVNVWSLQSAARLYPIGFQFTRFSWVTVDEMHWADFLSPLLIPQTSRWPPRPACFLWSPTRATRTCTCPRPTCGCTSKFCLIFWRRALGGRSRSRFTRRNRVSGASGTWWRNVWILNAAAGTLFHWRTPCRWFSPRAIAGRTWTFGARGATRWASCLF